MGAFDFQLGVVDEASFATPVTVSRFFEYNGDPMPIKSSSGRTEGTPLRGGTRGRWEKRVVPYFDHAEGTIALDVMDKGFGFWLKHLLPSVATTGAGPYTHTATEGTNTSGAMGKSFTAQFNAPFHPAGTSQPLTFSGGKVTKWSLKNAADEMLVAELETWFAAQSTAVALATASYPASMTNLSWAGGVVSIGGSAFDVTNISIEVDLGYNLDRKQLRGNTASKEPTPGPIEVTWSIEADFDSLAQWNRVHASTVSGLSASISGVWTSGTSSLTATIPLARFDELEIGGDAGALNQSFSGVGEANASNGPISLVYVTSDATP